MRTVPAFFSGEVALNGPRVRAGNTLGGLPRPKGPGASQRRVFSQSCDLTEGHGTAQFQAGFEFRAGGDLEGTSGSPSGRAQRARRWSAPQHTICGTIVFRICVGWAQPPRFRWSKTLLGQERLSLHGFGKQAYRGSPRS